MRPPATIGAKACWTLWPAVGADNLGFYFVFMLRCHCRPHRRHHAGAANGGGAAQTADFFRIFNQPHFIGNSGEVGDVRRKALAALVAAGVRQPAEPAVQRNIVAG